METTNKGEDETGFHFVVILNYSYDLICSISTINTMIVNKLKNE